MTQGYQDGRRSRDSLWRENSKTTDTTERETLRQRLNAFASQARKSSSTRRFEPCYRPIYPSKKRKATFKIPKKPPYPYIPAVYQKKTTSYRDKYEKMDLEPAKGRKLRWPPLYPSRRRDYPQPKQSADKSNELPPWLLPLYSCKSCHTEDIPKPSEARFSGGAFHRKMEIMESLKQIRAKQHDFLHRLKEKEPTKDANASLNSVKSANNAVEALKRRIGTMQDYLSGMKNMEAYRKKHETQKVAPGIEIAERPKLVRQAYARIYQTKLPTQDREVRVRTSMGLGLIGPKPSDQPLPGTSSNKTEQKLESANEVLSNKLVHTTKKQYDDGVAPNPNVESNISEQIVGSKHPAAQASKIWSVGEIHKESVVMIKQPSWKKQWNHDSHKHDNQSTANDKKTQGFNSQLNNQSIPIQGRATPGQRQGEISDVIMVNQQPRNIKVPETKTAEGAKTADAWTVESLKTRISVMKIKKTPEEIGLKKAEDMSLTRNGGEARQKISQVALRSFHKEAGFKSPGSAQISNTTKLRLGYQRNVTRRNFSTLRTMTPARPVTRPVGCCRRTISNTPQKMSKKQNWISRLKRCFVLEKIKRPKCENWKEAPREIPYGSEEVKHISPAPILWKPSDLDDNVEAQNFKPPEVVFTEKVNPAVLNAEQRVLASISRLISTKPRSDAQDVRIVDIKKKMTRAKNKVNLMPWFKRSKSAGTRRKLQQPRSPYGNLEKDEPQESGYEWILRNRDMIEELRRQSRYAAGKPLVPTEVKNAINQYKLPLKAEISRYRKKMDQKCTEPFYFCSTSKRWYSTCYGGTCRSILSCSDVMILNTRGMKTSKSRKEIPSKFLDRKTRLGSALGPNLRRHNQGVSNKNPNAEENGENPEEGARTKRWTWRIPNKTRTFTPTAATLTSPNKIIGTKMSEMSPCALKKQVEELKRLIKKAKEDVTENPDESTVSPQSRDAYEARLKRLVKAAHNNAQKMRITEPKYTSENNMLASKLTVGKKNSSQEMDQYESENTEHKPQVSVLKSLFTKTKGESDILANEILCRNNLASLPALAVKKKPEKHTSRVYLKLKSLVEAVRCKSAMLDPISDKILPHENLKVSISVDSVLTAVKRGKPSDTAKAENASDQKPSPETVELLAHKTPAPSNTIQLWKGDAKPKEFGYANDKQPTYGDLLTLFTKAKGLFYYQPPEDVVTTKVESHTTEIHNNSNSGSKNVQAEETSKHWLSIREDVSNAARAVSELKKNPCESLENTSSSYLLSMQPTDSGVNNLSEYMLTKSKMIPLDLPKSDSNATCDHMWASVPVKILEDEDLCRKPRVEAKSIEENQSASQPNVGNTLGLPLINEVGPKTVDDNSAIQSKLLQSETEIELQEPKKLVRLESTKLLFQKPIMALGSLTKNLGSGVGSLFYAVADSPKYAVGPLTSSDTTRSQQTQKTEEFPNPSSEASNSNYPETMGPHDTSTQPQGTPVDYATSNCPHVSDNAQAESHQNTATLNSSVEQTKQSYHQTNEDQWVQECIESMKPLEETVKTYENYYRNYFTEDILSGYENLHEVYEGLNKLNTAEQDRSIETPLNTGIETGNEVSYQLLNSSASTTGSQQRPGTHMPIQSASGVMTNLTGNGSGEIQSGGLREAAETKNDDASNQYVMNTDDIQESSTSNGVYDTRISENGQKNLQHDSWHSESQHSVGGHFQNTDENSKIKPIVPFSTECFIDPLGNIRAEIQIQESEPAKIEIPLNSDTNPTQECKDTPTFSGVSKEPANVDNLLTQDPTLNPEVVKKLKLPVILSGECHTEKNWYTAFHIGPHQNR